MQGNDFWEKRVSTEDKIKNFTMALDNIRKKEELNVIDQRLLSIMNQFDGSDSSSDDSQTEQPERIEGEGDGLA